MNRRMNLKRESPEQIAGNNSSGISTSGKELASGVPSISMANLNRPIQLGLQHPSEQHHLPYHTEQKFPSSTQQGVKYITAHSNLDDKIGAGDSTASISSSSLDPSDRRTIDQYNNGIVAGPFPLKLQTILKIFELEKNDLIKWQPHGRAFSVKNKSTKEFQEKVMARFFHNTKVTSFFRQINIYDFVRITSGPDAGCYYHEMFLRGKPLLASRMARNSVKGTKTSEKSSPCPPFCRVPDFYAIPPMPPLGPLANASAKKASDVISTLQESVPAQSLGQLQFAGNRNRSSLSPIAGLDLDHLQQLQLLLDRRINSNGSAARNEGGIMWAEQKVSPLVAHRTQQEQFSTAELLAILNAHSSSEGKSQGLGNSVLQMPGNSNYNAASLTARLLAQPSLNVQSNSNINTGGQIMSLLSALSPAQEQPQQQNRAISSYLSDLAGLSGIPIPQQRDDILYQILAQNNPMINQNMIMTGAANHSGTTTDTKNSQISKSLHETMLLQDKRRSLGLGMNDVSSYQQQNQNVFVNNNATASNNIHEALLALLMGQEADQRGFNASSLGK